MRTAIIALLAAICLGCTCPPVLRSDIAPGTNPWYPGARPIYHRVWGDVLKDEPRNPRPCPKQIAFTAAGECWLATTGGN
jgi:hypothetical protein